MAQHTQPLVSQSHNSSAQVQQTPTPHSSNTTLIQNTNSSSNSNNSNNHNNNLSLNNTSSSNNNNNINNGNNNNSSSSSSSIVSINNQIINQNGNNLSNNNSVLAPVSQAIYTTGSGTTAVVNTSQPLHYPGHAGLYVNAAPGAVHAHPHTSIYPPAMIPAHIANNLYANNVPANVNIPGTSGWANVVTSYVQTGGYNEVHADTQLSTLPLLQSSTVPQTPNMNMRGGMRRRGRGGGPRHMRDYNNQRHHIHQQQQHTITTESSPVPESLQTAVGQQLEAAQQAAAPIITGTTATTGPYAPHTHYAPAPHPYQFTTYPAAYFAPQMVYNTPHIVNYSYFYPPVVGPADFQYVPAGEEVPSDGRQSADGGMMPQMWHAQGIYNDEYGVSPEMSAIPVTDDYNQASSLGSAETMSPNYIYDTQIPELTQQIECMQLYDDSQPLDDNATMHTSHSLSSDPTVTVSAGTLLPPQMNEIGECGESLAQQSVDIMQQMKMSNENIVMTQQPGEYIIETTPDQHQLPHHTQALLPTPITTIGNEIVQTYTADQVPIHQHQTYISSNEILETVDPNMNVNIHCVDPQMYNVNVDYDLSLQQAHQMQMSDTATQASMDDSESLSSGGGHIAAHQNQSHENLNDVPKTVQVVGVASNHLQHQLSHEEYQQPNHQYQQQHHRHHPQQQHHHQHQHQHQAIVDHQKEPSMTISSGQQPSSTPIVSANQLSSPPSPKLQRNIPQQHYNNNKQQQQQNVYSSASHHHQQQQHQQQQQHDQRKTSTSSNASGSYQQQPQQQQQQPPRRKHSSSDQNTSTSGNDKYMQTTKSMSWTNSSQHKKSTASVGVTAAPLNQNHGRNKHNHTPRATNQNQNRNLGMTKNQNALQTSSSSTVPPPVTQTNERKHSYGGGDPNSLKTNNNKYKQNSSNSNLPTNNSMMPPSNGSLSNKLNNTHNLNSITNSSTPLTTSTAATLNAVGPNQFAQQQYHQQIQNQQLEQQLPQSQPPPPPPQQHQSHQVSQNVPQNQFKNEKVSVVENPTVITANQQPALSSISASTTIVPMPASNTPLCSSSSSSSVSSAQSATVTTNTTTTKQYSGFEQKKPVPRTTSPTSTNNVSTSNLASTANETAAKDIATTTATIGTSTTSSLTNIPKSTMASLDSSLSVKLDSSNGLTVAATLANATEKAADSSSVNINLAPPVSATSAPANNTTTSWASLFSSSTKATVGGPSAINNRNSSSLPNNFSNAASSSAKKPQSLQTTQQLQASSPPQPQLQFQPPAPAQAQQQQQQNKLPTTNDAKNVNNSYLAPGPMSYSAASAQGLNNNNTNNNNSSSSKTATTKSDPMNYSNAVGSLVAPPASTLPKAIPLDEWTSKYAEFLAKQKTDLAPISLRPRGLTNRSNYCYINSILQALLGCSPLFNLIRSIPKQMVALSSVKTPTVHAMINFTSQFQTMPSGLRLRTNNRRTHKGGKDEIGAELQCDTAFEPTEIYKLWHESRKDEGEGRQEDAEEFLGYVLNKLNDEMEEVIKLSAKPKPELNGQSEQSESEDGDAWQMICNNRNRSSITRQNAYVNTPLSDIFRGELRSRLQREGEHSTDVIQPFFTLQLNIEKATSVKEALELLSGLDQLEGVTGSKSKQEVLAWQQMTIEKLPIVLILHLKYFDYRQDGLNKIIKKVDFPVELKIDAKIMATKKYSQRQRTYRLIAVVYHDGKEASKGHYIADVYHTGYSSWLRYDDNSVKPVTENHVLVPRAPRVPYLLYYRRCDTMQTPLNNNNSHATSNQTNGNSNNSNASNDRQRH